MKLFFSATLKLAGWYLLILMTVSLLFSGIIFQVASSELDVQLNNWSKHHKTDGNTETTIIRDHPSISTTNLLISLGYLNLIVLLGGGVCAYILARRTLEPIEAAHDAQSRFTANASHQLRTPLAVIKAEAELALSDQRASKASLRQTLQSTLEETDRLTQLTETLLKLSSANRQLETTTETFDITDLTKKLITERKADTRTTLTTDEAITLTSHRLIVRELIAIILDNALCHSPRKSRVQVDIKAAHHHITVCLTNDGQIAARDLPHIFERFFSGDQRTGGYGLGLSLAKQLAGALGGQLTAASRKGTTTFTISLPKTL